MQLQRRTRRPRLDRITTVGIVLFSLVGLGTAVAAVWGFQTILVRLAAIGAGLLLLVFAILLRAFSRLAESIADDLRRLREEISAAGGRFESVSALFGGAEASSNASDSEAPPENEKETPAEALLKERPAAQGAGTEADILLYGLRSADGSRKAPGADTPQQTSKGKTGGRLAEGGGESHGRNPGPDAAGSNRG